MEKYPLNEILELALGIPDNTRKRQIVNSLPRELSYEMDGEPKTIKRELLLTEGLESGLIQTSVAQKVAEGADLAKCWFNVAPVIRIKGNAYNHPYGEAGFYASTFPEAAEIHSRTQNYGSASFAIQKIGTSPRISNEMIEDGMVDVIAEEIRFAGISVMNKAEQICNDTFLEGSGDEHDASGSNLGVKAVISACARLRGNGFMPTDVVMHPEAEAYCLLDLAPSSNFGGQGVIGNGLMPPGYLGLKWHTSAVADVTGGSYTWDYDSDGDMGMLVVDRNRFGGIAVARPLTVEGFDDPIHDMKNMAVTMRMDAASFVSTAACRVEF